MLRRIPKLHEDYVIMARRRTKKTITDEEAARFKECALALREACIDPMSTLRTDARQYGPLRDLVLSIGDSLRSVAGYDITKAGMRTSRADE